MENNFLNNGLQQNGPELNKGEKDENTQNTNDSGISKNTKPNGKKIAIISALTIFIVIVALWGFFALKNGWFKKVIFPISEKGIFNDFSKLVLNPAYAEDFFELFPSEYDSLGVGTNSFYTLKSKEPVDINKIKENLKIEPAIEYEVREVSSTEWQIIPAKPLEPNTLFKASLAASYFNNLGTQKERDYSWVYQIKDNFRVLHSIPRHAGTNVPLNTGIEITLSHENFKNYENYFEISPAVQGSFEKHGRTLVFIPEDELMDRAVYTVKIKQGLPLADSNEILGEGYSFSFETEAKDSYSQPWVYLSEKFLQSAVNEKPVISVFSDNSKLDEIEVKIYGFAGWEDYLKSLEKYNSLPSWSSSRQDFLEDTSSLRLHSTFNAKLITYNERNYRNYADKYIEFPEPLNRGFYLIEFASGKDTAQAWLQVSNLSIYVNSTKTDTLVWVNDVAQKVPASNTKIEIFGTSHNFWTDDKGIAKFSTPEEVKIQKKEGEEKILYYKISKNNDISIFQSNTVSRYYWWRPPNQADDYWNYLYSDRPMYKPTDTIKFWGMIKKRTSGNIGKDITVSLYKNGYVDYYYNPVEIVKNKVSVSEFGTFEGEIKLNNIRPDYYTLELKVGDELIKTRYLNISRYTKPAYEISLTPEKRNAYAGETIKLKGRAAFFEGTPVPNLKLVYHTPEGDKDVVTDENGEVNLTYTKNYYNCSETNYNCWPDYINLSLRPKESELADISANSYINFYGPNVYLKSKISYPEKGKALIAMESKYIDLNALEGQGIYTDKSAPNMKITGDIIMTKYIKRETGTHYDFINKKTYKSYSYDRVEKKLKSFSAQTGQSGKYDFKTEIEPETSYQVKVKIYDSQGRYDNYSYYLYYYDGYSLRHYNYGYNYYYLDLGENKSYKIGEGVKASFMNNEELAPAGKSKFLFMQLQNGLQEYAILDKGEYNFSFEERDVPNVNLMGVYFNGLTYYATDQYYGQNIIYDNKERELKINIETDKKDYKPGEEVKLNFIVKDKNNNPKEAEINLNLVDEAYYALAEDFANPIDTIYSSISSGVLYSKSTDFATTPANKESWGGAEKGGCFAAGTKILMADGSQKAIEKIKKGERIKTFANPLKFDLIDGEVKEIWQGTVNSYLIINNKIKVTPDHQIFSNGRFTDAGLLKISDWMISYQGEKIEIKSIDIIREVIPVFNLRIDPERTYFAEGVYVHNQEKGGGPREFFTDAALFKTVRSDSSGKGEITFKLPDNITSWRVTAQGISRDIFVGLQTKKIPVSLPVFEEVTIGEEYLNGEEPIARSRSFGTALKNNDEVEFNISSATLNVDNKIFKSTAFNSVYFPLGELNFGLHQVVYNLKSSKGNDSIKLPLSVISSRLQAQFAKSEKLTTETKITAENDLPIAIVLSDIGQNQLYNPLLSLSWEYGDRIDQKLARKQSRELLEKYYKEEIYKENFDAFNYQLPSGGITLLPYSSEELELSARVASNGAEEFDKESLAQYLFQKLENKASGREDISYALYGLASLKKPVLPRLDAWLKREDLSIKEKLYLAQALYNLGAEEWARDTYYNVISNKGEKKDNYIIINTGKEMDDIFAATAVASVLASSLNAPERDGLWNYLIDNQKLWGNKKNSEVLFNLEKLNYIKKTLPNLKPQPAAVKYELSGQANEIKITGGNIYAFQIEPEQASDLKFKSVEGDVGISARYTKSIDLSATKIDNEIGIKREYYVNGQKTNSFKDTDIIEIRLYPKISSKALKDSYQITDILPSGLAAVTKMYFGQSFDCHYWYPYNLDGQIVKYRIWSGWGSSYCGGQYIRYFARPKNRGKYKAESAIIQSFLSPSSINYSDSGTITISE